VVREFGDADIENPVSLAAGFLGKGAGEKGFADARGSDDDDVLVFLNPIPGEECCFSNYFVVNFLIKLSLADLWQIILMGKGRVPRPFRLSVCF